MKKFLITAFTLLISLGVMAQATNDRTLRLYYGGEVIFSRLVSQLDSLNFKVNAVEEDEEDKPVVPDISTCNKNYSESGLYLGVIGFNNKLTEKELGLLTPSTVNSYKTFVNKLSVGNATVLYYAEENGLNRLTQASFPSDLISASIVTFTDGLDQGSVAYNEYYENMGIAQYLTDLNGRILSEKVCGSNIKIDAYAIGLQGKDVQDVDAFKNNLKKLSSSEDKMFEANDMDEVNETFNNIARSLYSATSIFSMTFNIPMPSNGEVIRFTFDNVEKAEDSKCYIEGTYRSRNLEDLKFEGCLYQGPAVISGVKSGVEMSFSFEGLSDMNNEQLPRTNIQNFKKSSVNGIWQLNSEFDGNSNVEIEEEQKTAVVMLVLDCSSSLGDDFARMKSAANNFISLLLNASEQNNTVSFDANGGTGSMSSMTFGKGETKTLTANTFTRTGYTFTGWNTKADGTGISYTNKQSITPTENLTLYAQWELPQDTKLYFVNSEGWEDIYVYIWSETSGIEYTLWPGVPATKMNFTINGWEVYSFDMEGLEQYEYIIFNDQLTGVQTGDLVIDYSKPYLLYADQRWYASRNEVPTVYQYVVSGTSNSYSWVDLGLPSGTKWANCNVGSVSPEEYGSYYAWGETSTKSIYTSSNYTYSNNPTTLPLTKDVANVRWGGDWRMPTTEQIDELEENCTWDWIIYNGVKGLVLTSKINGNSIFLPAAGKYNEDGNSGKGKACYYMSSSIYDYSKAEGLIHYSRSYGGYLYRYEGHTVRPVLKQ